MSNGKSKSFSRTSEMLNCSILDSDTILTLSEEEEQNMLKELHGEKKSISEKRKKTSEETDEEESQSFQTYKKVKKENESDVWSKQVPKLKRCDEMQPVSPPKSTIGPISPMSQKAEYYSLGGRSQIGLGVSKGWIKIYIRQVSSTNWHTTQIASLIEKEFRDLVKKFEDIDEFLGNDLPSVTFELIGGDKVCKVSKDCDLTKVSIKRKFPGRLKGCSLSVVQYLQLKEIAPKILEKIDLLRFPKESEKPDYTEALGNCMQMVLSYKIELMTKEPRIFCKKHDEEGHDCTMPKEFDWYMINKVYPIMKRAIDLKSATLLVKALAEMMEVNIELDDMEKKVMKYMIAEQFSILSNVFCDHGPVPGPVKKAFQRLMY